MTVRVGVLGAGPVATGYHFPVWEQIPELEVAAVYDLVSERAEAATARFGGKVCSSHIELIEQSGIDALFIFLPPFAHEDQAILAARNGIPFFVEKPVTLTLEKAREIDAVVQEMGVMTSVGYNWRYQEPTIRAKDILGDTLIGMLMGYWLGMRGRIDNTHGKVAITGGQIVRQSTHIVDTLRYFGGEVESVYFQQALRTLEVEGWDEPDVGTLTLTFDSGAIGTMSNAQMLPNRSGFRAGVEIFAKDLHLDIGMEKLKVLVKDGATEYYLPRSAADRNPYWREDKVFVEAVKSGDPSKILSTYADAVKTLEVTLLANESAKTGQAIQLEK
jgi:predicted dehydrogenase